MRTRWDTLPRRIQRPGMFAGGDGRTLDLDFTQGVLDSRITFSRTTLGTYVGSDGLLYGSDTSTSSQTIGSSGTKTFTLAATAGVNRRYAVGDTVIASSGANNMSGTVTSYDPSTQVLVFTATSSSGSGTLATWIIGTRMARFDHNPSTLAARGLLIEGSATNSVTYSNCRTTGWSGINATGTNDNATAPDNTTTATLWTGGSGGNNRAYSATFSITNGTTYTASVYVKKPSTNAARYAKIDIRTAVEGDAGWPGNGVLDLDTGIASGTGFTVTPMPNGWYRIVSTGTVNTTASARAFLRITDANGSIAITSTNALLWWGAQLETGSGASSYIPTAASQGTRAIDEATMTSTNFSSWFGSPTSGTMYAQAFATFIPTASNFPSIWRFEKAGNRRMDGFVRHTNGVLRIAGANAASGGTMIDIETSPNTLVTAGVQFKQAVAMSDLSWVYAANAGSGVNTGTNATVYFDETVDSFRIGMSSGVSGSLTVSRLTYWPFALPDATLQSLTQ